MASHYGYVQLIIERSSELLFTECAIDWAAEGGHLNVIKVLHTRLNKECTPRTVRYAAGKYRVDVVIWIYNNNADVRKYIDDAVNRHPEIVTWLRQIAITLPMTISDREY